MKSWRTWGLWVALGAVAGILIIRRRGWQRPIVGAITSGFGMRRHPVTGELKLHAGIDFGAATGTPVVAARDGEVVIATLGHATAGNYVVVQHADRTRSRYLHLSRIDVKVGDKVSGGQTLGLSGATGRVTGPHLHFEIIAATGRPMNPALLV